MEWRRQYRIDNLLEDFKSPEVLKKYFAAGFVGRDKQRNPGELRLSADSKNWFKSWRCFITVVVVRYGMGDMKGVLNSVKKKDYIYHVISLVEETLAFPKKDPQRFGRPNAPIQSTIIFDMDQFSMRHITYKPGMAI